ncbi:MAG: hypothetical protein ABSB99_04390 [Acidimicrobiales bacterium]|jgi:hypothetical protein
MSEDKSEIQRLVDLLVCAPGALVQSATEELEKLVEEGRHRVDGQLHTARLVGQVAVQAARRQAEQVLQAVFARVTGGGGDPQQSPAGIAVVDDLGTDETGASTNGDATAWVASGPVATENGPKPATGLAIPGYDSLSASQVVQRLDGLSRVELEDVRDHEFSHRHRRTILNRVDQLLRGAATGQPS